MKSSRLIILLIVSMLFTVVANAQVGINTDIPNYLTELDVKNVVDGDTIPRGIMVPRMSVAQRSKININDQQYVNGLLIYNTDEDCFNYFSRAKDKWISLCGDKEQAIITITNCATVLAAGTYKQGDPLTENNYIELSLSVQQEGPFSITAMSDPFNGYYFSHSGEFLTPGDYTIKVPAFGIPANSGSDEFIIKINDVPTTCKFSVSVQASVTAVQYSMICNTTSNKGAYRVGEPTVSNTHYIEMNISAIAGNSFFIQSDKVNGVRFVANGTLGSGIQTIRARASGTPIAAGTFTYTLTSNSSSGTTTCAVNATVVKIISKKTILAIGYTGGYQHGYNIASPTTSQVHQMITDTRNFGTLPASVVKDFDGFALINGGMDPNTQQMYEWLINNPVEIVVVAYDNKNINATIAGYYKQYLDNGGIVIAMQDRTDQQVSQNFLRAIFPSSSLNFGYTGGGGTVYQFQNIAGDPILSGPFTPTLQGKYWGEDASSTVGIQGIPASDIITYSYSGDGQKVNSFRHKTLNLVWVGDGGFISSNTGTSSSICPFKTNGQNYPIVNSNFSSPVCNSVFFANALAWAVSKFSN